MFAFLKSGVDPKWMVLLGFVIGLEKGIGQGAISLTNMIPDSWIPHVLAWMNGLAWGGTGLMTLLAALCSNATGPLISVPNIQLPSIDAVKTAAKIVLVAFALSFLVAGGTAQAQTRKLVAPAITGDLKKDLNTDGQNLGLIPPSLQVQPTGNVAKDLQSLWDKIVTASNDDLAYASKLAASANTPASAIRKQCWDAIVTVNNQANGLALKDASGNKLARPDPHLFTDVETLAEVVDNLSPSGPLFTACAGAAQLAKTNVLTFVNAVVTGAAGMAAMPIIPGL